MTTKDRLKSFVKEKGYGRNVFEEEVGIAHGYLSSKSKSITSDTIERVYERFPELSLKWLLTGKGEMIKSDSPAPVSISDRNSTNYGNNNNQSGVIGNNINIHSKEQGNFKIINENGVEISYDSLPQVIEMQHMIDLQARRIKELENLHEQMIERHKSELSSKDVVIQSKDEVIKILKESVEDLRSSLSANMSGLQR